MENECLSHPEENFHFLGQSSCFLVPGGFEMYTKGNLSAIEQEMVPCWPTIKYAKNYSTHLG